MSWDYRVFKETEVNPVTKKKETFYSIRTVHFEKNEDAMPSMYGVDMILLGDNLDDLEWHAKRLLDAFKKPTLQIGKDDTIKEVKSGKKK